MTIKTPQRDNRHTHLQFPVDLVTLNEEIRNGRLHFLCSAYAVFSLVILNVNLAFHFYPSKSCRLRLV